MLAASIVLGYHNMTVPAGYEYDESAYLLRILRILANSNFSRFVSSLFVMFRDGSLCREALFRANVIAFPQRISGLKLAVVFTSPLFALMNLLICHFLVAGFFITL